LAATHRILIPVATPKPFARRFGFYLSDRQTDVTEVIGRRAMLLVAVPHLACKTVTVTRMSSRCAAAGEAKATMQPEASAEGPQSLQWNKDNVAETREAAQSLLDTWRSLE
jgi:hypothetical protein